MEIDGRKDPFVTIEFSIGEVSVSSVALPSSEEGGMGMGMGIEFDPNSISAEAAASNTSFSYSGRHDHGQLPPLHAAGHYAQLVTALQEAKLKLEEGVAALDLQKAREDEEPMQSACKKPRSS